MAQSQRYDGIIGISETWWDESCDLFDVMDGYRLRRRDRQGRRGGGGRRWMSARGWMIWTQEPNVQALPSPLPRGSVQKRWHLSTLQGQGRATAKKGSHHAWQSTTPLWSAGRPCAGRLGLPFPPAARLDALPPLSHSRARGAVPLAGRRVGGGSPRTPDPPETWSPPARQGDPRHGMRRGLEPRAHEGRRRAVPVPKGQPFTRASNRAGGSEPQQRGPQTPRPSSFSHIWASFRPQAPHAQARHIWPHAAATVTIAITVAPCCHQPPHCLLLGTYKNRGPCSWPTVRRASRPSDAKHAWKEEEAERRGGRLPTSAWDATELLPATREEEGTSQEAEAEAAEEEEEEEEEEEQQNHPSCRERHRPRSSDRRHAAHGCRPTRERRGAQPCLPAREQPEQRGGCLPTFARDSTETVPATAKEEGTSQEPEEGQSAEEDEEEEHHPSCHESHRPRSRNRRRPARSCGHTGEQHGALACLPAEARCEAQARQPTNGRRAAHAGASTSRRTIDGSGSTCHRDDRAAHAGASTSRRTIDGSGSTCHRDDLAAPAIQAPRREMAPTASQERPAAALPAAQPPHLRD